MNKIKKTIYTLNTDIDGYRELTNLTYPYIKLWAHKIGAEFVIISERKFQEWYITYEKLQIYEMEKDQKSDFIIYIDSDALLHPDFIDVTAHLSKDTVAHTSMDMANLRWHYDNYFLRDGRNIGSCNWFTVASDWCLDLWKPIDDMTPEETYSHIFPIQGETERGVKPATLIDDYALSRNIAKYGFKFAMIKDIFKKYGDDYMNYMSHNYAMPMEEKIVRMKQTMINWRLAVLK